MEIIYRPNIISGDICLNYFHWYLLILVRTSTLSSVVIRRTIIHSKSDAKTPSTEYELVTVALVIRCSTETLRVATLAFHSTLTPRPTLSSALAYNTAADSPVSDYNFT